MKTIIAGSRSITSMQAIEQAVKASGFDISLVISGGAAGVDTLGEIYAQQHDISTLVIKADWRTHGKSAGYKRNTQMLEQADALIAVWDGSSKGTAHMIGIAQKKGIPVYVQKPKKEWDF